MITATTCRSPGRAGGGLALRGRAKLRAEMTTPAEPSGCDCGRCAPPPLDDLEAQAALRHVSNADAVAFAQGLTSLVSFYGCDDCGAWVPTFTEFTE